MSYNVKGIKEKCSLHCSDCLIQRVTKSHNNIINLLILQPFKLIRSHCCVRIMYTVSSKHEHVIHTGISHSDTHSMYVCKCPQLCISIKLGLTEESEQTELKETN